MSVKYSSMAQNFNVVYTDHLRLRMKLRGIPRALPRHIWLYAKEKYYDKVTQHFVAVMTAKVKNKIREFALTYDVKSNTALLITIHPIKALQKASRVKTGRWQRL